MRLTASRRWRRPLPCAPVRPGPGPNPPQPQRARTPGTFTSVDVTGSIFTEADGINDLCQVAGYCSSDDGIHGFIASPITVPEPSALVMVGTGVILMGPALAWRRRTRRSPA
jgi:PEP-CTERM motif